MAFEPLNLSSRGDASLTIDKFYRLRVSASALRDLAITQFTPVVVSVDVENKRVGLVKQDLAKVPNAKTVRPDKRGYLGVKAGKMVADKLALSADDLPARFEHVGRVDEGAVFWNAFELAKD
ncbi:hypothetical protein [Cytobacillus solani]|uniref:Uncharacterized protein n=1 Tax=Cytobacillus solani TaxID=1637975 RepID=A0A0Q3QM65_9BACI|nr:hypothetical protein [Cytobacillus solani]KQL18838.1 hypothetical protein AN957_09830 [Cytobacillus solani]